MVGEALGDEFGDLGLAAGEVDAGSGGGGSGPGGVRFAGDGVVDGVGDGCREVGAEAAAVFVGASEAGWAECGAGPGLAVAAGGLEGRRSPAVAVDAGPGVVGGAEQDGRALVGGRLRGDAGQQVEGEGDAGDVVDGEFEAQGVPGVVFGLPPVALHGVGEGQHPQHVGVHPLLAVPFAHPAGPLADLDGTVGLAQEAQGAGEFDLVQAVQAEVLAGDGAAADAGLEVFQRGRQVVHEQGDDADDVLGVRRLRLVVQVLGERVGVAGEGEARGEVLGGGGEESRDPQAARPFPGRVRVGGERAVEPVTALAGGAAGVPVEPQGAGQAQAFEAFVRGGEAEVEGGAEVVLVGTEPGDDLPLPRPEPGPLAGGGPAQHPVPLPAAGRGLLAGQSAQPVQAVLAEGVEEAVADTVGAGLSGEYGFVDEAGDGVEDVFGVDAAPWTPAVGPSGLVLERRTGLIARTHRLRRLQIEAARQHRQPRPRQLLAPGAQFTAPVDRRPQGLVAGQGRGAAAGEEAVAVVQAVEELVHVEHAHADRGEFDGEWEAVEAAAEPGDGPAVGGGQPEAGDHGGGPVGEERQGRVALGAGEVAVRVGDRQGPYVEEVFLGEAEAVAAGGEDPYAGRAVQQRGGELGAGRQQVFAVVDQQQQSAVPQPFHQRAERWPRGVVVQVERVGGGERDERGVVQAGEVHEADAVGEGAPYRGRDARGEAGLADAARAGQGDQPCPGQQFTSGGEFAAPVDEAGRLDRQPMVPSWR
nr:hypothetical protein [Streptomyces caeruleatus]